MVKNLLFLLGAISFANAQIQSENFEGATMPAGWAQQVTGPGNWTFGSNVPPFSGNPTFASNAAIFNDDALGSGPASVSSLLSPAIDITGYPTVALDYDYYMNEFSGNGLLRVEVYTGSAWQQVQLVTADVINMTHATYDVTAYKNSAFQVKFTFDDEAGWSWGAAIDNFALSGTLSDREFDNRPDFRFYPNPVRDAFTVSSAGEIKSVKISDVSGKTVLSQKPDANSKVDASRLNAGIYLMTVEFENGTQRTQRLIKK